MDIEISNVEDPALLLDAGDALHKRAQLYRDNNSDPERVQALFDLSDVFYEKYSGIHE